MKEISEAEQLECFIREAVDYIKPQKPFGGLETAWVDNIEALKSENNLPELKKKADYLIRWAFNIQNLDISILIRNCLSKNCDLIDYYFHSNEEFLNIISCQKLGTETQHWLALFYVHRVPDQNKNAD